MIDWGAVKLVTVDGDGTLWDFESTMRNALVRSAEQFAVRIASSAGAASSITALELRRLRDEVAARPEYANSSMEEIRRASFAEAARRIGLDDADFVDTVYRDYMEYRFRHLAHFPDARPFLTRVREAGILVALVTNGNTTAAKAGLADDIDESFVAHAVGLKKPDPRLYHHVLTRMGVAADCALHIGDDPTEDVDAARRAGLAAAWLDRTGGVWPAELAPAACRFTSLDECLR